MTIPDLGALPKRAAPPDPAEEALAAELKRYETRINREMQNLVGLGVNPQAVATQIQSLASLNSLIELLVEKGVIGELEYRVRKAREIDHQLTDLVAGVRRQRITQPGPTPPEVLRS